MFVWNSVSHYEGEEQKMRLLEIKVVKRISGYKGGALEKKPRQIYNEMLHNVYSGST
jgi:hypothetical protein